MNRKKGSSLVELGAGLIVLVPIFLYGLDYASVFLADLFNANICRDAARAAVSGPPTMYCPNGMSDANRPRMRAKAVIDRSSQTNAIIQVKPLFKQFENVQSPFPQAPYGGPVKGWVRIQTSANLNPPFLLPYVDKAVVLTHEEQFPFTWVMPSNYTGIAAGKINSATTDSDP
jgi:hypothetical protein